MVKTLGSDSFPLLQIWEVMIPPPNSLNLRLKLNFG